MPPAGLEPTTASPKPAVLSNYTTGAKIILFQYIAELPLCIF